jgi:small subunit ribosomal protein S20
MPNIESARKRARQAIKRNQRNRAAKSEVLSGRKAVLDAIEAGNKNEALKRFAAYASELDTSAKKGIIKANNASRKKSRIQLKLNAMPS